MNTTPPAARFQLAAVGAPADEDFARAVETGLRAFPKELPCRFLYDAEGSRLFEEICRLPEYYIPEAEESILEARADDIAGAVPAQAALVELGCGRARKTRLLIEALLRRQEQLLFVPVDISRSALESGASTLLLRYPTLRIAAACGEYQAGIDHVHEHVPGPKLILWLGSNIGNSDREAAERFLARVRAVLGAGDRLLVGFDLRKDREMLRLAYDDPQGVTARFNKNVLARINRELGGHFDLQRFRHVAFYNEDAGRVELFLVSTAAQRVQIERLELVIDFHDGEPIHTEDSYKYSRAEIETVTTRAGLALQALWMDGPQRFASALLRPA